MVAILIYTATGHYCLLWNHCLVFIMPKNIKNVLELMCLRHLGDVLWGNPLFCRPSWIRPFWRLKRQNSECHTADLDSAPSNYIESTVWQILLWNALQSLSSGFIQILVLTIQASILNTAENVIRQGKAHSK